MAPAVESLPPETETTINLPLVRRAGSFIPQLYGVAQPDELEVGLRFGGVRRQQAEDDATRAIAAEACPQDRGEEPLGVSQIHTGRTISLNKSGKQVRAQPRSLSAPE